MDAFVIEGGQPLRGTVRVSGAKNAALPIMAATLLTREQVVLDNVPDLTDIRTMSRLLETLGCRVNRDVPSRLTAQVEDDSSSTAHYDLLRRMRAGICVLGPLLARRGTACVSLPGGCNIGHRPIDLHLRGLAALGAEIQVVQGYVMARASRLRGARVNLLGPWGSTVTGTCNVLMAAVLARGTSVLEHAAQEPEVIDLANFLNHLGARIHGQGTSTIIVEGIDTLEGGCYRIIPDRVEAGTWLVAGALCGESLTIRDADPSHLISVLQWLKQVGIDVSILASSDGESTGSFVVSRIHERVSANLTTAPYPGFPTDLQAQAMVLLCLSRGSGEVRDDVFPERFMHASELCRMGADIERRGNAALVRGVTALHGANVMACDLRASAALVLAALSAEGTTVIRRIYHLDRGYERLDHKLQTLGARVERISDSPDIDPPPPPVRGLTGPHYLGAQASRMNETH